VTGRGDAFAGARREGHAAVRALRDVVVARAATPAPEGPAAVRALREVVMAHGATRRRKGRRR
jgi:hypothetical protein